MREVDGGVFVRRRPAQTTKLADLPSSILLAVNLDRAGWPRAATLASAIRAAIWQPSLTALAKPSAETALASAQRMDETKRGLAQREHGNFGRNQKPYWQHARSNSTRHEEVAAVFDDVTVGVAFTEFGRHDAAPEQR
jgi:hypothetical protein